MPNLMVRLISVIVASVLLISRAHAVPFLDEVGNFNVDFPRDLVPIPGPRKDGRAHTWTASLAQGQYMSVAYSDAPEGRQLSVESAIKNLADKMGKIVRVNHIERHGLAGREVILLTSDTSVFRWRFFLVGTRLYQVFYRGPSGSETDSEVEAFLNSFQLLSRDQDNK